MFALAVLDSAGAPIVGGVDAVLILVSTQRPESAHLSAACATLGSLIGSTLLFFLARKGGEVFLHKQIASGRGRQLHLLFQQYGLITVFVPALSPIPLPMKIPVFCAGALQVRYEYFIIVVLLARLIRYFGLAYLATHYGEQTFVYVKRHGWQLGLAAVVVALIAMMALRLLQKREASAGIPQ